MAAAKGGAPPASSPLDELDGTDGSSTAAAPAAAAAPSCTGDAVLESLTRKLASCRESNSDKAEEARALLAVADRLHKSQKLAEARKHASDALTLATTAGNRRLEAETKLLQFRITLAEEKVDEAQKEAEKEVKYFKGLENCEASEMYMALAIADLRVLQGRFKEAEAIAMKTQESFAKSDDSSWGAVAWETLANIYLSAERHDKAIVAANKAKELAKKKEDSAMVAAMSRTCSRALSSKGAWETALAEAEASKALCEEAHDKKFLGASLDLMANALLIKRDGWNRALPLAEEYLNLSRELGDVLAEAAALTTLASTNLAGGKLEDALKAASQALKIVQTGTDLNAIGEALETAMNVKPEKSQELAEEELSLARKAGNAQREALALKRLAGVLFANDLFEDAISKAREARELQKKQGDQSGEAITCSVIADYCINQKKHEDALEAARAAQALMKERGNIICQAQALQQEFRVHCAMEDVQAARNAAWAQHKLFQEKEYKEQEVASLLEIADFEAQVGSMAEAMKPVETARKICQDLEDKEGEADVWRAIANIHLANQAVGDALKAVDEAEKLSKEAGDAKGQASALQTKTSVLIAQGRYEEAASAAKLARQILHDAGHAWTEANAIQMIANVYLAVCQKAAEADKDPDVNIINQAQTSADEAVKLFQSLRDTEGQASALLVASSAQYYAQDGERALQFGREALDLYEKFANNQGMANAWLAMARGAFLAGQNFAGALEAAEEARRLGEALLDEQIQRSAASLVDIISDTMRKAA